MTRIEKLFFGFIIRAIVPISSFLTFWWGSLAFTKDDKTIAFSAITGLFLGLIIVLIGLRDSIDYCNLSNKSLVFVYLFYNIFFLVIFMGFPLFNVFLGLIAGFYFGRKLSLESTDNTKVSLTSKRISFFTAIVMFFIVSFSALIVLFDKYRYENIKNMLGLSFNITPPVLIMMVLGGGVFLIISQYWITKLSIVCTFRISKKTH